MAALWQHNVVTTLIQRRNNVVCPVGYKPVWTVLTDKLIIICDPEQKIIILCHHD